MTIEDVERVLAVGNFLLTVLKLDELEALGQALRSASRPDVTVLRSEVKQRLSSRTILRSPPITIK